MSLEEWTSRGVVMYIIQKIDSTNRRCYVARSGSKDSYTGYLQHARVYASRSQAEADKCPENEMVVELSDETMRR